MINPGGTIGILGGGQLGRMLAMAAARLGYRCHVYAPEADSVAAEVSAAFTCAAWDDAAALAAFAAACDVVTYEFENVPVAPLAALAGTALHPHPRALETAQDRLAEKTFARAHGGTPAPFMAVDTAADLARAVAKIGAPGILKTRRDGYDGKGQWRIAAHEPLPDLPAGTPLIYEGFVTFEAEFSVILCRAADGRTVFWDSAENTHVGGILSASTLPASPAVAAQVPAARALAGRLADALGYVGVMTAEFFATAQGPVFNEMAPRVHNSGHWSIEGAVTSQFENHVRAILGLPLGDTALAGRAVRMDNLVGEQANDWAATLADPAAHLHLYGKGEPRPGRKMGHVTRVTR
ncbi:5-(carboxyamino)imidazole ribonucleotide synthase [Parablastomonas sp. CN1-191]|uniref:5-(carboxyamino)imidazole ribonucleotide synthase n=1 Tax=Parablastomonas sp. CN1-191 TaxID=3400908 RepID=UPI003BF7AF32